MASCGLANRNCSAISSCLQLRRRLRERVLRRRCQPTLRKESLPYGGSPPYPGFFASLPSQCTTPFKAERGEHVAPFGLAPLSALELRPRIALPSAQVSNSVAGE